MARVTIEDAAWLLAISKQALREWLKKDNCKIGTAYKPGKSKKYMYIIFAKDLCEVVGKSMEQVEKMLSDYHKAFDK